MVDNDSNYLLSYIPGPERHNNNTAAQIIWRYNNG